MRRLRLILPLLVLPALLLGATSECDCSQGPRMPETSAVGSDCGSKPPKREKAKKTRDKANEFKKFATRDDAIRTAKKERNSYPPGRARYRGPCRRGGHVHVDVRNKSRTKVIRTIHYEWPNATKEGC